MPLFWRLFCPAAILCGLGLIDDRIELKSWQKLLVQGIVVLTIWYIDENQKYTILGWALPTYIVLLFQFVWIILIINAFNLIDGLDGLASGLAIVSSICLTIWFIIMGHLTEAICMLILAGSYLGFLRFNFYLARIFLGDTGSTFIGLIFAIIGLSTLDKAITVTSLVFPLLAIGVPLFDVILAIWRRSTRKLLNSNASGVMKGDQDHLHHRLFRQTKNQSKTAFMMYLMATIFAVLVLLFLILRNSMPILAYITLVFAVLVMIRQLAIVEIYDSAQLIQKGLSQPRQGILINMIHPIIDFFMISLSFGCTTLLFLGNFHNFHLFLYAFIPIVLLLCFSGVYRVFWLRAGLNNYWYLAIILLFGSIISSFLVYYRFYDLLKLDNPINLRYFSGGCFLFTLLNITLINFERFFVHYGESFLFRQLYLQNQDESQIQRIVIYGGGLKCRIYINY